MLLHFCCVSPKQKQITQSSSISLASWPLLRLIFMIDGSHGTWSPRGRRRWAAGHFKTKCTYSKQAKTRKEKKKTKQNKSVVFLREIIYNLYPSFSSETSKGLTRFNWDGLLFSMTDKSPHFWVAGLLLAPHAISERPKTGSDIEPKAADIYCTRG